MEGFHLDDLPTALRECRPTRRLLEALSNVEVLHANMAAASSAPLPQQTNTQMAQLRAENKILKQRQTQARERVEALLAKLPTLALEGPNPITEAMEDGRILPVEAA